MKAIQVLKNQPKVLSLEVTTRCNLECIYCTKPIEDRELDTELLQRVRNELGDFEKVIICGIGESFLYTKLYELIAEFKDQKFCIVTNGTIPINYHKLNMNGNVEMLIFSIDAIEQERLDQINGRYKYEKLLKNLEAYDNYNNESKNKIQRVLNCTLNEHNITEIMKLVEFAHQQKFETIHFSLPRGNESFIEEKQVELNETLMKASKKARKYGMFFADPFETCCVYFKWITPYLSINGDIFACAETLYLNQRVGNLLQDNFKNIWPSPEYKKFQTGVDCQDCKFLSNCKFKF